MFPCFFKRRRGLEVTKRNSTELYQMFGSEQDLKRDEHYKLWGPSHVKCGAQKLPIIGLFYDDTATSARISSQRNQIY